MFNHTNSEPKKDISDHIGSIRHLSSKIEQKIAQKSSSSKGDNFIETLSVEELKDLRQVILAADYLLSKYQDKKDLKEFLEEFVEILMHATNSVNVLKDDLNGLIVSAETALKEIQTLHDDVTHNLSVERVVQTKLDEYREIKTKQESSPNNLTNPSIPIYTQAYLRKTTVEI